MQNKIRVRDNQCSEFSILEGVIPEQQGFAPGH